MVIDNLTLIMIRLSMMILDSFLVVVTARIFPGFVDNWRTGSLTGLSLEPNWFANWFASRAELVCL